MYIKNVETTNFRNCENKKTYLCPGVNVICGKNAQGKTNFIESIYVGAMGKSFKNMPDANLIKFGEKNAEINLEFFGYNNLNKSQVQLGDKKSLFFNGLKCQRRSEFLGNLNVVLFTPGELSIVQGGPAQRRKYIDLCIGVLKKKYIFALYNYTKILENKNKLLKSISQNKSLEKTLFVWNEKLCEYGAEIIFMRSEFIKNIKQKAEQIYSEISGGEEKLSLAYITSARPEEGETKQDIFNKLMAQINQKEDEEIKEGCSLVGPHRDDIYFYINTKRVREFGSQGQQRSVVLTLKLVQAQLFYEHTGENPVVLLDDVKSELDLSRRKFLLEKIKNCQVILTCTDDEDIKGDNCAYFSVEKGKIKKM